MWILLGFGWPAVDQAGAEWLYDYRDDFTTDKAQEDSYLHSVFWPEGAFPPPEPYLYYQGESSKRALVFMDYVGQPAHLGYCFPIGPAQALRSVKGTLQIDVRFAGNADVSPSPAGYLLYSISDDGGTWSIPEALGAGHQQIAMESVQGTCYIIFFGTRVMVDNLRVQLHSPPATLRVPQDFKTIQQAIDAAADDDVIEVDAGTYTGAGNRDIEFRGKAITVRSAAGPEQTIIDCSTSTGATAGGHRGFYFHQGEKSNSVLRGFTIRGGRVRGSEVLADHLQWNRSSGHPVGGGIYCEFSSPTIINCVITGCGAEVGGGIGCVGAAPAIVDCLMENCTAGGLGACESGGRGGGIGLIRASDAKISNCRIRNNSGYYNSYGAGIYCWQSSAAMNGCELSSNTAPGNVQGGGLYCAGPLTNVVLKHCIISHNAANAGGGIFAERRTDASDASQGQAQGQRCSVRVTNCTIAHNRLSGPQMPPFPGGGIHSIDTDIVVKNSIVWYNDGTPVFLIKPASKSPVVYSDIERGYLGQGNIDEPPLFAPTHVPDYHLQSIYGRYNPQTGRWVIDINHSLCIDAGDPRDPIGHEPYPNGNCINMGAYGGTRQASKSIGHLVYHVDRPNGNDANNGLSRARAFATIQKGVDSARNGDTVMVWPAVYEEEVSFDGKAITVQSAADAAVVTASTGYAFSFYTGERSESVLRNFVIRDSEYAIFCNGASPTITNVTIVNNGFGIAAYGGGEPDITNCILWNNASGDLFQCQARYSCIEESGHNDGEGNISANPLFADVGNADYHLRSRYGRYWPEHNVWIIDRTISPCIDAADPAVYPRSERMPHGGRMNMGAYGGTPYASMSEWPLEGDVNRDGTVDMEDFAALAENWLKSMPGIPHILPPVDKIIPVDMDRVVVPAPVDTAEREVLSIDDEK
jgi:hypothetical protein